MFTKKDFIFSIVTGLYTGLIAWRIFVFLGLPVITLWNRSCETTCLPDGPCTGLYCVPDYLIVMPTWWFVIIVPVLWVLGVNLGYFLGRWLAFFNQFGKFAAIGFTNAAVDFGILNLLIAWSGVASGILFAVFKATSFILAVTHSYGWNKYWVFTSQDSEDGNKFFKFLTVNIIAAVVNVGVASLIVNGVDPVLNLDQNAWANIGAVTGSAIALIFSFIGLRLIVFRMASRAKNDNIISQI